MNHDLIHDLKTRLDLRELVEAELGPGQRSGQSLRWPCPFHQGDNPTALAVEQTRFRCWACDVRGDLFDWLRLYHGLDFRAALVRAADLAGVVLPPSGSGLTRPAPPQSPPTLGGKPSNISPLGRGGLRGGETRLRPPHRPPLTPPDPAWQQRHHRYVMLCQTHLWHADHAAALAYLRHRRGLTDQTIRAAILGYDPQRRLITIPWYWRHADGPNELWRVSAKSLLDGRKQPPFVGFKPGLYHGHALDPTRPALLLEGEIDTLTAWQEAGELIVPLATGGASSGREATWLGLLCRLPLVLVAFDNDRAGEQGAAWWLSRLPNARRLRPMGVKDVNEMHIQGVSVRAWLAAALDQPSPADPDFHRPGEDASSSAAARLLNRLRGWLRRPPA